MKTFNMLLMCLVLVLIFTLLTVSRISTIRETKPCEYFKNYTLADVPVRCYSEFNIKK